MQLHALFDPRRRDALRGAVASGDLGPVLRRRAEPSGKPDTLSVFIPNPPGVPMEEAIRRADEAGVVIASNKKIDSLLNSEEWEIIKGAIPCWTGTMTGYVEPGRTFQEAGEWNDALKSHAIVHVDKETKIRYLFPIPEEHLDKKDSILVAEHPGFRLETDGNDRIVRAARLDLIARFPADNGWYKVDGQFGIPFGEISQSSISGARYLVRCEKRICPVARGYNDSIDDGGRDVDLYGGPSESLGVAVDGHGARE